MIPKLKERRSIIEVRKDSSKESKHMWTWMVFADFLVLEKTCGKDYEPIDLEMLTKDLADDFWLNIPHQCK